MATEEDEFKIPVSDYVRNIAIGLGIVAAILIVVKFHPRTTFAADGLSQHWDAAVEQSRAAHEPVLVLFTADWCPACNALHADVLSRNDIQTEIDNHYLMVTVDMTEQGPIATARARRYHIGGVPTLIRFDADGNETGQTHYKNPQDMMAWLKEGHPPD